MSTRSTVDVRRQSARSGRPRSRRAAGGAPCRASRRPARSPRARARSRACPGGRGGTGRRTRTAWSSPRARRPARAVEPVAAERVALQPGEQVVEDLLADPPAARAASARGGRRRASGSRPPRAAGPGRRARRGRARRRRRAGREPRRGRSSAEVARAPTPASASSSASIAWSRPICSSAPSRPERLVAARSGSRSPRPSGSSWSRFEASWARSQRRRSSRSSASIIDWSSARCSGVIERSSDCIAAIRSASCSMMSSRVRAPGKNRPCFARNSSTSSWPARRPRAAPEQRVEVADHLAVRGEVLRASCPGSPPTGRRRTGRAPGGEPLDQLLEPLARRRLEEVVVLRAPRIRSPTSRGSASSWSSRRAAASRSIARSVGSSGGVSASRACGVARRRVGSEPARPRRAGARSRPAPRRRSRSSSAPDVARGRRRAGSAPSSSSRRRCSRSSRSREAGEVAARRSAAPAALHEPPERLGEVALGHDVVGERVEDLVGVEVRRSTGVPSQRE